MIFVRFVRFVRFVMFVMFVMFVIRARRALGGPRQLLADADPASVPDGRGVRRIGRFVIFVIFVM